MKWGMLTILALGAMGAVASSVSRAEGGGIVISEVQTGSSASASQEFIELYNNSATDANADGYALVYVSASGATKTTLVELDIGVRGHGYALYATAEAALSSDGTFKAGMSADAGTVQLVDAAGVVVDMVGWAKSGKTTANSEAAAYTVPAKWESIERKVSGQGLLDTAANTTDFQLATPPSPQGGEIFEPIVDTCTNLDGIQTTMPERYYMVAGDCVEAPALDITELFPNPSVVDDSVGEFVELYNPNDFEVSLEGYILETGADYQYHYTLGDTTIPAQGYVAIYAAQSKLTLGNSVGAARLLLPTATETVTSVAPSYSAVGTDQAWALEGDEWLVTDTPTPGAHNVIQRILAEQDDGAAPVVAGADCPEGKYRNPETNRCRALVETAATDCKTGEARNPETNRCRKIVAATATAAICRDGYERNPDTNRCRKVVGEATQAACKQGYSRNPETGRCKKDASAASAVSGKATTGGSGGSTLVTMGIGLTAATAAIGYGIFEWRSEISRIMGRFVPQFAR
jgi:Lamin Tail Domain